MHTEHCQWTAVQRGQISMHWAGMLGSAQGLAFPAFLFNQTVGVTKLGKVFYHNVSEDPRDPKVSIRKETWRIVLSVQLNRSSKHLW